MKKKYVHLMIRSFVRKALRNLIDDDPNHTIIIVEKNKLFDESDTPVSTDEFKEIINSAEVVFAHFLNRDIAKLVLNHKKEIPFVWFSWGADIYDLGRFNHDFLLQKTRKLYYRYSLTTLTGFKSFIKRKLGAISDLIPPNNSVLKAAHLADFVVPIVKSDFERLKTKYPIKAELFELNYLNSLFVDPPDADIPYTRNNILVGNSASFTNNHIEVIDKLTQFDLRNSKVIMPLSYGNKKYAEYVTNYSKNALPNNIEILTERYPFSEYLKFYTGSKSVIMNHQRQQAVGNIIFALMFETSLFLNPVANHYKDFKERGFHILDINDFHPDLELTTDQKKENKYLLNKWFGKDILRSKFKTLLNNF